MTALVGLGVAAASIVACIASLVWTTWAAARADRERREQWQHVLDHIEAGQRALEDLRRANQRLFGRLDTDEDLPPVTDGRYR